MYLKPEGGRTTANPLATTGLPIRDCFRVADDTPATSSFASHNAVGDLEVGEMSTLRPIWPTRDLASLTCLTSRPKMPVV